MRWTREVLEPCVEAWLASLEPAAVVGRVGLYHGSPRDPIWEYILDPEAARAALQATTHDLVLVGHTHTALVARLDHVGRLTGRRGVDGLEIDLMGPRTLVNPGSVGQPRDGDARAAYVVLELDGDGVPLTLRFARAEYAIERTQQAIVTAGLPSTWPTASPSGCSLTVAARATARSSPPAAARRAGRGSSARCRQSAAVAHLARPSSVTTNGTGFVVCAVCGLPSGSRIVSALPWSAVTSATPPRLAHGRDTARAPRRRPRQPRTTASMTPGVPDHVGVREVHDAEPEAAARGAPRPSARRRSSALISGFRSYVVTSRGDGTRIRSSPSWGGSRPPLKKYVTCAYFSVSATWSCPMPGLLEDVGEDVLGPLRRERDVAGLAVPVRASSTSGAGAAAPARGRTRRTRDRRARGRPGGRGRAGS